MRELYHKYLSQLFPKELALAEKIVRVYSVFFFIYTLDQIFPIISNLMQIRGDYVDNIFIALLYPLFFASLSLFVASMLYEKKIYAYYLTLLFYSTSIMSMFTNYIYKLVSYFLLMSNEASNSFGLSYYEYEGGTSYLSSFFVPVISILIFLRKDVKDLFEPESNQHKKYKRYFLITSGLFLIYFLYSYYSLIILNLKSEHQLY